MISEDLHRMVPSHHFVFGRLMLHQAHFFITLSHLSLHRWQRSTKVMISLVQNFTQWIEQATIFKHLRRKEWLRKEAKKVLANAENLDLLYFMLCLVFARWDIQNYTDSDSTLQFSNHYCTSWSSLHFRLMSVILTKHLYQSAHYSS